MTGATGKKAEYDDKIAEIAAEREIAALEGEGIARAYQEFTIRQALIQQRWEAAKALPDQAKAEELNLRYYAAQLRMAKELNAEREADDERNRSTEDASLSRVDNRLKRERDAALASGKITADQHRALEVAALKKQEDKANADAAALERRAQEARNNAREPDADKLDKAAIERRTQADNFGFDAADLERKSLNQSPRPVGDSLARLGLGGNVAPQGLSSITASNEKIARNSDEMKALLKQILDKPADVARFSR